MYHQWGKIWFGRDFKKLGGAIYFLFSFFRKKRMHDFMEWRRKKEISIRMMPVGCLHLGQRAQLQRWNLAKERETLYVHDRTAAGDARCQPDLKYGSIGADRCGSLGR